MPEDATIILLMDMGYDRSERRHFISGKAAKSSEDGIAIAVSDNIFHFLLVEDDDFYAYAWEPGIAGATGHQTYHSASNFMSQWFNQAKRQGYEETAFWISLDSSGYVESLNEFYSNYGTHGYSDYHESELEGVWYRFGDPEVGDYYVFYGDFFERYDAIHTYLHDGEPYRVGTWYKQNSIHFGDDHDPIDVILIALVHDPDDPFGSDEYSLTDDGMAFFDTFHKTYYIRESSISTYLRETFHVIFTLVFNEWAGPEFGDPHLRFDYYSNSFGLVAFDTDYGEYIHQGRWSVDGNVVTLEFIDGETEVFNFDENSFYIEYFDMIFENEGW